MKKTIIKALFIVAILLVANNAYAQDIGKKRLDQIEQTVEKMGEVMQLDEKKKTEVLELKKIAELKLKQVSQDHDKGTDEFKEARKKVQRNYQLALKKICSKEQINAWRAYQKANKKTA